MHHGKESQGQRKSHLDLNKKFNCVFQHLAHHQYKIETADASQKPYMPENMQDHGVENKMTPTFKMLSGHSSSNSSPDQYLGAKGYREVENYDKQIGVFMSERSVDIKQGSESQHEMTYIDKLNDSDQVIMPYSQEQINSKNQIKDLSDFQDYYKGRSENTPRSNGEVSMEEETIQRESGQMQAQMHLVGDNSHERTIEQMERTLQFEQVKVLNMEEQQFIEQNEAMSQKLEQQLMLIEKQISSSGINQNQYFSLDRALMQQEPINIEIDSDNQAIQSQDKMDKESQDKMDKDTGSVMNDSFEELKRIGDDLRDFYDSDEEPEDNIKIQINFEQQQPEKQLISEDFFTDIRQAHLGVGKTPPGSVSASNSSSPDRKQLQLSQGFIQQQLSQGFTQQQQPQSSQVHASHEQTVFESFDEGSTQFYDCNLLLNNSLSFTSNQNMLNRSLSNSRHNVEETPGKGRQKYNLIILEDMDEDQDDGNLELKDSPGKQAQREHFKSQEYIKLSEQDLLNLQRLNLSRESMSKESHVQQRRYRENKMLIINNLTGIFFQLLHEYKTHYSQFIYTVQEELYSFKQSFVEEKELLYSQLEKHLEFVRHQLKIRIRQEIQTEYETKLGERMAVIETELLNHEEQWKKEVAGKIEEEIAMQYEERYQNMIVGARNVQLCNQYDDEESSSRENLEHERDNDDVIQSYLNKQNLSASNILPVEISMFATTNELNDNNESKMIIAASMKRNLINQRQSHVAKRESRKSRQRQMESILQELQMQNESLCEQLMIQHEHTEILNEQQVKYREQVRKMNDLEEELEDMKNQNIDLKSYLFQLEEEKEQLKKIYEHHLEKGDFTHEGRYQLEHELQLILEASQELKDLNLKLELTIQTLNEEIARHKQELMLTKGELTALRDELSKQILSYRQLEQSMSSITDQNIHLQKQTQNLSQELQNTKSSMNVNMQQLQQQKISYMHLLQEKGSLENEVSRLNSFIQELQLKIKHYEQLEKKTRTNPNASILHSQQQSLIQNLSRSNLKLSRASSQGSLINPVLNQHCITSNNSIVNQILQNIKHRKTKLTYNHQNSSVHYYQRQQTPIIPQGIHNKIDSAESYQFELQGRRMHNYSSQQDIQYRDTANESMSQNSYRQSQLYQLNQSHLNNYHTGHQEPLPIHSPKSPSSTSIVSKKVTSSEKDKKMSMISLKLQKLRSDIKEEIKQISTIAK